MDPKLICRACGYIEPDYYPYGEDLNSPEYDFCVCCGVEHGYEDWQPKTAIEYREKWISSGAKWHKPEYKPENWDLKDQLNNLKFLKDFFDEVA